MSDPLLAPPSPEVSPPALSEGDAGERPSLTRRVLRALWNAPALFLLGFVWLYQKTLRKLIGALFGRVCRFEPSCSEYFVGSVKKYGAMRGAARGIARICRCHPFHPGGYDPP